MVSFVDGGETGFKTVTAVIGRQEPGRSLSGRRSPLLLDRELLPCCPGRPRCGLIRAAHCRDPGGNVGQCPGNRLLAQRDRVRGHGRSRAGPGSPPASAGHRPGIPLVTGGRGRPGAALRLLHHLAAADVCGGGYGAGLPAVRLDRHLPDVPGRQAPLAGPGGAGDCLRRRRCDYRVRHGHLTGSAAG